jgi:hypothetical protein
MPRLPNQTTSNLPAALPFEDKADPTFKGIVDAAIRSENDVYNFFDGMQQPTFDPDPEFSLAEALKKRPEFVLAPNSALNESQSQEEFDFILQKIAKEREDQDTLNRAGVPGFIAAVASSIISPTSFLPLIGQARGARAIAVGAGYGLLGAGAQEVTLQANQVDRSGGETALAVGTSAILGGVLGGIAGRLTRAEREALESGMAYDNLSSPIPSSPIAAPNQPTAIMQSPAPQAVSGRYAEAVINSDVDEVVLRGKYDEISTQVRQSDPELNQRFTAAEARVAEVARKIEAFEQLDVDSVSELAAKRSNPDLFRERDRLLRTKEVLQKRIDELKFGEKQALEKAHASATGKRKKIAKQKLDKATTDETPETLELRQRLMQNDFKLRDIAEEVSAELRIGKAKAEGYDPSKLYKQLRRAQRDLGQIQAQVEDAIFASEEWATVLRDGDKEIDDLTALTQDTSPEFVHSTDAFGSSSGAAGGAATSQSTPAGKLKGPQIPGLTKLSPVTRQLQNKTLPFARFFMAQLSTAGLRLQGNTQGIASSVGGTVEQRIKVHHKLLYDGLRMLDEQYVAWRTELGKGRGPMTRKEFNVEVSRAMRQGGEFKGSKAARMSADRLRSEFYTPLFEEAKGVGMFDNLPEGLVGDEEYLNRVFRNEIIEQRFPEFVEKLAANYQVKLEADIAKRVNRLRAKEADLNFERQALDGMDTAKLRVQYEAAISSANKAEAKTAKSRLKILDSVAEVKAAKTVNARIKAIDEAILGNKLDEGEKLREMGIEDADFDANKFDTGTAAMDKARETAHKILGTYNRLPARDILVEARGAELRRVLNINSTEIEEFLENDIEILMSRYLRTLGPDIELTRKLGDSTGTQWFTRLTEEHEKVLSELPEGDRASAVTDFQDAQRDLMAVISRMRHTWGIPNNPTGVAARAARVVMNINTLRFMGSVMISSIPDLARPIFRYGLTRTFRDGFIPMIANFKTAKLSMEEAKLAGTALDVLLHTRAAQMADIMDDYGRGTGIEKALNYGANRMGAPLVGGFDVWNSALKQFSSVVVNAELMQGLEKVVKGSDAKATEKLASVGINREMAERIWEQVEKVNGGGGQVDGVWLPNTEKWTDVEAVRAYRAALVGEIDDTIITPGVERPLWMDSSSLAFKLLGQFRSFTFSSTQKVVMAGMQQRDMAVVQGMLVSLAFGALSYYIRAQLIGGTYKENMESATTAEWADNALYNSGLLGVFAEVQAVGSKLPATAPYSTFAGRAVQNRSGQGIISNVLGPSFDMADTAVRIASGIDEPTDATVGQARKLVPYQNLWWLRSLFNEIEDAAKDGVPDSRR